MRRLCVISLALVALGLSAPAHAQQQLPSNVFIVTGNLGANPEIVVARLMAFDRNHDGFITRAELPERMQPLLDKAASNQAIDATQIRRIALTPAPNSQFGGLQAGHYGFGDFNNFDTRLHIDGAIDDLRLASDVSARAKSMAYDVQATASERARTHLLSTMETILTAQQFENFKASVDGQFITVQALKDGDVTVFGATPEEAARLQKVVEVKLRTTGIANLSNVIANYHLTGESLDKANAEIEQFNLHRTGRLSSVDRQAILDAVQGLLDDQQRDDLRAALERRPIVKQGQAGVVTFVNQMRLDVQQAQPLQPGQTFAIQDLLLRDR
jgi:hypothetical protein